MLLESIATAESDDVSQALKNLQIQPIVSLMMLQKRRRRGFCRRTQRIRRRLLTDDDFESGDIFESDTT